MSADRGVKAGARRKGLLGRVPSRSVRSRPLLASEQAARRFVHPSAFHLTHRLFLDSLTGLAREARSPEMQLRTTTQHSLSPAKPHFSPENRLGREDGRREGIAKCFTIDNVARMCAVQASFRVLHMALSHSSGRPLVIAGARYDANGIPGELSISWPMRDQQPSRWSETDGTRVRCDGSSVYFGYASAFWSTSSIFRQAGSRPLRMLPYRRSARSSLPSPRVLRGRAQV
jgi:hypothetical protein